MDRRCEYSVFEYLYRDAGNYKTHAQVLLRGRALDEDHAAIRRALDDGCFVPARVELPALHEQHWRDCGSEFDNQLDHPQHEFTALRRARFHDIETLTLHGTVAQLAVRFTNGPQGLNTNLYYLHLPALRFSQQLGRDVLIVSEWFVSGSRLTSLLQKRPDAVDHAMPT